MADPVTNVKRQRTSLTRSISGQLAKRSWKAQASYRAARRELFNRLTLPLGATVFLGDSITEGAAWAEWFPTRRVVNRGIGGDTTDGVLARLDSAIRDPSHVFVLIGTNDVSLGRGVPEIAARVVNVAVEIRRRAPQAQITVQSVLPRRMAFAAELSELNSIVASLLPPTDFLNLWPEFADRHGALKADFTFDGLHLNGAGYERWMGILRPLIEVS